MFEGDDARRLNDLVKRHDHAAAFLPYYEECHFWRIRRVHAHPVTGLVVAVNMNLRCAKYQVDDRGPGNPGLFK